MAGDAFEEALAGSQRWAGTTERKLSGDLENDAAELDRASEVTGAGQRYSAVTSLLRLEFSQDGVVRDGHPGLRPRGGHPLSGKMSSSRSLSRSGGCSSGKISRTE